MTDYWTTYKLSLLVAKTNRLGAHSTLRVKNRHLMLAHTLKILSPLDSHVNM